MKHLLRNKGYMTLMAAQAVSSIGDWLSIVAVITLVGLKWNASPMEVSFIILCLAVPMALLGPVAGTVADRFSPKTLMVLSDLVRAGLILLLAAADTIWVVYVCLFTIGIFSAVFIPAKNGKLKELVPDGDMKSAMSITSMIDSSTKVLGPLLSGVLVAAVGVKPVFFIDSSTFLISSLFIFFLPNALVWVKDVEGVEPQKKTSFKEEFLEGISFIKADRYILAGLFFLGFSLFILQLSDSQIIVLLRELTHPSADLFGYLVTASGAGMFASGFILAKKTNYPAYLLMLGGVCGIGLSFGMMAVCTLMDLGLPVVWGAGLGLIAGFSAGFVFIPFQASVQTETPVHMTGRVFGVVNSVTTMATIVGPLLGGLVATVIGVIPTFMVTASLLVIVSFIGLLTKSNVERGDHDVSKSKPGAPGTTTG
ncbi:MFS transporter [Halobacillus rhizosphaerae]|uniref:MFS transporter n=1 Tax=Halobacillus rhizosphaerae TaxID=3064889 RepID=UPI00398A69E4